MRTVRVKWEGPLSLDEVKELDDDEDCGLYQIYGHHIIFGDDSLLYIGMTTSTFRRRFIDGTEPHISWMVEEEGVSVYVGRLVKEDYEHDPPDWSDWENVLKDAEALTIYWHSPPYNSRNIGSYNGQELKVINNGKRGDLCEQLPDDRSPITMKFLLQVFEMDLDPNCVVQSDVFEVTRKKKDRILQEARKKALNNVLRKDLRDLFEKQRWKTGEIFGRFYTFREYEEGEYRACLLITDPSEDATTFFYQPSQRGHV